MISRHVCRNIWSLFFVCVLFSCKKLVSVPAPLTSVNGGNVFNNDATAISALTGVYANMSNTQFLTGGMTDVSLFPSLSADELVAYSGLSNTMYAYYYTNGLTSSNTGSGDFWKVIYPYVYSVNSSLEGLNRSIGLTPAIKKQLTGEAKFLRAFFYFYLTNLYGNVPLATSSDYSVNSNLPRSNVQQVYKQIISDLIDAQRSLSANYLDGTLLNTTSERTRPTAAAATALLARAYLYTQNWDSAAIEASNLINNSTFNLDTLNGVFLRNSTESIWQLQPVGSATKNTREALTFIIPVSGPGSANPVYLSSNLINAFEGGDLRRIKWIDSVIAGGQKYYFPYKYKINSISAPVSEYIMVLRLAEQYMIRAEARAHQGNLSGADSDLNIIRTRAGLPAKVSGSQDLILGQIQHERQVEFFTEWGNRWFDLKRNGTIDSVMTISYPAKVGSVQSWNTNWQYYPIPLTEIQYDPNLVQNIGY